MPITNDTISQLVENPYFEYLIAKKTRSQTWGALGAAGSLVLGVLAYGGCEFKSIKSEMDNNRTAINSSMLAVRQNVEAIDRLAKDMSERAAQAAREAQAAVDSANKLTTQASATQAQLFQYQSALLQQATTLGEQASLTAGDAKTTLQQLQDAKIPSQLQDITRLASEAKAANDATEKTRIAVEILTAQVALSLTGLKSLEQVNQALAETRTSELFLLRERRTYTVTLPDITPAGSSANLRYTFSFRANEIGKAFQLSYSIHRSDASDDPQRWQSWSINAAPAATDAAPTRQLERTPFEVVLLQRYYGFFSPEFVVLKIRPVGESRAKTGNERNKESISLLTTVGGMESWA